MHKLRSVALVAASSGATSSCSADIDSIGRNGCGVSADLLHAGSLTSVGSAAPIAPAAVNTAIKGVQLHSLS
jgi:hypothetical protein